MHPLSVKDSKIYENMLSEIHRNLLRETDFPEYVFSKKFSHFYFFEFDSIFQEQFFKTLNLFLDKSKPSHFNLVVLDPDPVSYFKNHFGYYNCLSIPLDSTWEIFEEAIHDSPDESPIDSIYYNSTRLMINSKDERWTIIADRSYEFCILASNLPFKEAYGQTVECALENFIARAFRDETEFMEFKKRMIINYRNFPENSSSQANL